MTDTERRYQELFEHTPVALWENDFTDLFAAVNELIAAGVTDFEQYFEEHPEMVGVLASKVRTLEVNRHTARLFGARTKEEILIVIDKVFEPETFPVFRRQLVLMASGENYFEGEVTVRTLDGRRRHMLLTVIILDRSAPQVRGLVSMVDISERKRIEEVLREINSELERSNRDLEQFAYIASHDLQEPLRTISSYAQLLSLRYASQIDERADKYIHYMTDGAKRMQRLISNLLELSRAGARSRPLQPTDCMQIVQQVLQNMEETVRQSSATVTCAPLPTVLGDDLQLAQLFQNLIANGIKFHGEAPPRVHVDARRNGPEWLFSVQDNGIGIEEQHLAEIFVAFRRLHGRDQFEGTGIGLAVAKRIVERHNGRIWAESTPGQGTTFFFTLPAVDEPRPAGA